MKKRKKTSTSKGVLSIRVERAKYDRVCNIAERMQWTKSAVVRFAIERVLDEAETGKLSLLPSSK